MLTFCSSFFVNYHFKMWHLFYNLLLRTVRFTNFPCATSSFSMQECDLFALPLKHKAEVCIVFTSISRQADFSKVIWSAMVSEVKPGRRLANSTIFIMHFVESSLNLSHSPRSS